MATTKYLYLKQCPGTDAEPGLPDGAAGPASFRDANGALLWVPRRGGRCDGRTWGSKSAGYNWSR